MSERIWLYGGGGKPKPEEYRCVTVSFICSNCRKHIGPEDETCKHCGETIEGDEDEVGVQSD